MQIRSIFAVPQKGDFGVWRSWLAHLLWEQGVPCSSHGTPTRQKRQLRLSFLRRGTRFIEGAFPLKHPGVGPSALRRIKARRKSRLFSFLSSRLLGRRTWFCSLFGPLVPFVGTTGADVDLLPDLKGFGGGCGGEAGWLIRGRDRSRSRPRGGSGGYA